jgi:SAM-dependent methyltransferase
MVFLVTVAAACPLRADLRVGPKTIAWDDIPPPLQAMLTARGLDRAGFPRYVAELRLNNEARMRQGDLDHLVYFALQSTSFTDLPSIEPASSAAEFNRLGAVPRTVAARIDAFTRAAEGRGGGTRLAHFRTIFEREKPRHQPAHAFLSDQYIRAMIFLYEKEFASREKAERPNATATLYQERGLSTDTSVDAGYVVYLALGALRQLESDRRIRRVLIVGPGLDVAPRTGLVEVGAPQSYQPFAVIDALVAHGLAERAELQVTAIDISPRVVEWFRGVRGTRPRLTLFSGVSENDRVRLTDDYRSYFAALGRNIGTAQPLAGAPGRLAKSIELDSGVTDSVDAAAGDIALDQLDERFDLIVVTNVFPYLSDVNLLLAFANITRMLAPGGVLVHNEPRPLLAEATLAVGLPLIHSRSAVIATVEGARSPLYDAVWMHRAAE